MAKEDVIKEIHHLFESVCLTLFQSLGCEIKRILEPSFELGEVPLASMDAGSRDLEVMLFIGVPLPILALTYPGNNEDIVTVEEARLEEWIPELANQLMGKLKNKLLQRGCELQTGLPNCYFGHGLSDVLPQGYDHAIFYFDVDGEVLESCLSIAVINDDMVLTPEVDVVDTGSGEGELELF